MSNLFFQHFPSDHFSTGKFQATVIDSRAEEITDGIVTIYLNLLLIDPSSKQVYTFLDTIVNHMANPRSREFFEFLSSSNIVWEQYEDLIGLTFETTVAYEQYGETVLPILCRRRLLASPLAIEE